MLGLHALSQSKEHCASCLGCENTSMAVLTPCDGALELSFLHCIAFSHRLGRRGRIAVLGVLRRRSSWNKFLLLSCRCRRGSARGGVRRGRAGSVRLLTLVDLHLLRLGTSKPSWNRLNQASGVLAGGLLVGTGLSLRSGGFSQLGVGRLRTLQTLEKEANRRMESERFARDTGDASCFCCGGLTSSFSCTCRR
jgi:hypothetical protein